MSWQKSFERVEPYIVKISTPAGAGTGFFFAYNASKSLIAIATALHVVQEANEWRYPLRIIHVPSGRELFLSHGDRVIFVDYVRDSAVILVSSKAIADAGLTLPKAMLPLFPSHQMKKIGVPLAWAGYPAIAPSTLCLFQGGVSAFNPDNDSYFIDGVAINGVSGGPVFDDMDQITQLVGIVSAYRYNRQGGGNLPGLLMAHDATHLNKIVENIKSLDEAQRKAAEAAVKQKEQEAEGSASPGPPEPEGPLPENALPRSGVPEPAPRRVGRKRLQGG